MRKHLSLYGGILVILLSFLMIYTLLTPRVGLIGGGPPKKMIWFFFSIQILSGLALITQSFLKFRNGTNKT
jgi:hypothetical protein